MKKLKKKFQTGYMDIEQYTCHVCLQQCLCYCAGGEYQVTKGSSEFNDVKHTLEYYP